MFQGIVKQGQVAKIWDAIGGRQVGEIRAGRTVQGTAPRPDGYVYLSSPVAGYTKMIWLSGYVEVVVTPPPPPPPPPPPTERTVTHVIDILSDGSITIDGNPYP